MLQIKIQNGIYTFGYFISTYNIQLDLNNTKISSRLCIVSCVLFSIAVHFRIKSWFFLFLKEYGRINMIAKAKIVCQSLFCKILIFSWLMIVYIQNTECVLDNIINISTNVYRNSEKTRKVLIIPKRPVGRIFSLKQQYRTVKKHWVIWFIIYFYSQWDLEWKIQRFIENMLQFMNKN